MDGHFNWKLPPKKVKKVNWTGLFWYNEFLVNDLFSIVIDMLRDEVKSFGKIPYRLNCAEHPLQLVKKKAYTQKNIALYQVDISTLLCSSMSSSWQLISRKAIFTLNLKNLQLQVIFMTRYNQIFFVCYIKQKKIPDPIFAFLSVFRKFEYIIHSLQISYWMPKG